MFPLNRMNHSTTLSSTFQSSPRLFHQLFNNSKQRREEQIPSITTTSLSSNLTSFSSSTQQQQQISLEEPYSAKTGIKTAALLGGM